MKKLFILLFAGLTFLLAAIKPAQAQQPQKDLELILESPKIADYAIEVLVDSKQRIVLVGAEMNHEKPFNGLITWEAAVWRFLADGQLDVSFGENGHATSRLGAEGEEAQAAVLQPDDKIITGGISHEKDYKKLVLSRYLQDGSKDSTFGDNGNFWLDYQPEVPTDLGVMDMEILPDGKVLVLGHINRGEELSKELLLFRVMPDGRLDEKFGESGKVVTSIGEHLEWGNDLELEPDGTFWVAGTSDDRSQFDPEMQRNLMLMHFLADGSLDTNFAEGGIAKFHGEYRVNSPKQICLLPNGQLAIAGKSFHKPNSGTFFLLFLNSDEPINTYLPENQFTMFDVVENQNDDLQGMTVLPDNSFLLFGYARIEKEDQICLAHFSADGKLNLSFGDNGASIMKLGGRFKNHVFDGIAVEDETVILTGALRQKVGYSDAFILRLKIP